MLQRFRDARWSAIEAAYAVIEFAPDGHILRANANFLAAMGYQLDEIVGQHHRMFVDPDYARSEAYRDFWRKLGSGEAEVSEFLRYTKSGTGIWIEASYNPVFDRQGRVERVIKLATDVTEKRLRRYDYQSQVEAFNRSQCVIEFDLNGHILKANENFLDFMGFREDEIIGKHHSLFCDPTYARSDDYADFWKRLSAGEFAAGEFERRNASGDKIWLQASYNPVRDLDGKPVKVVKLATDVTQDARKRNERETLQKEILDELGSVAGSVETTSSRTESAVGASASAAQSVQAVAAGAEELAASFGEISRNVNDAMTIAREAVSEAEQTQDIMGTLSNAAQSIGQVVELINSIADQTNLLALNATIEAARAGESGRGFAVVANEVKALAGQTSQAIDEISGEIGSVQASTESAVDAISRIGAVIARVETVATGIASAVDEQSAVTTDISQNMQSAAIRVQDVSQSIEDIASLTADVEASTASMSRSAAALG